ncbi:hypothetical protein HanXRQr2_Chr14g0641211 [Helianthus annuus]|uniref:Uncharacterized protein n=1 Tax=Helianthus annuus TaxID=4232 RepID=A0A9K3H7G4_HELAN|nr:hypothetical protein HanXRQr2_Chr14g0641211 [Helianthus annuus]KAJ0468352.1 hypothetical protein HanIR_Chr14g0695651 [Helianthus annuus]
MSMKTVSGRIVSTKPLSLSKAAYVLSNFVSSDNGASQPVAAYLRRASAAFDELAYFKKHIKSKKYSSKDDVSTKSDVSHRSFEERDRENGGVNKKLDHVSVEVEVTIDEHRAGEGDGKLKKKERKRKKSEGSLGSGQTDNVEVEFKEGDQTMSEKSEEKKKKKKKRKNAEVDGGETSNSVTPGRKKRRKTEADD